MQAEQISITCPRCFRYIHSRPEEIGETGEKKKKKKKRLLSSCRAEPRPWEGLTGTRGINLEKCFSICICTDYLPLHLVKTLDDLVFARRRGRVADLRNQYRLQEQSVVLKPQELCNDAGVRYITQVHNITGQLRSVVLYCTYLFPSWHACRCLFTLTRPDS